MANLESQLHAAKAYLLTGDNSNLYDHLTECLSRVLDERPANPINNFEELSRSVKREKLRLKSDVLQDTKEVSSRAELAVLQKPLFAPSEDDEGDVDADEEVVIPFPNVVDTMSYFEEGGVGLGKDETYRILLALKQLTKQFQLTSVRFWGKIFGTQKDYLIAEGELEGDEEDQEEEEEEKQNNEEEKVEDKDQDGEEGEEDDKDELPKSAWKKPPVIPKEEPKTGTNKKSYFACNEPGEPWTKLPHVKPADIVTARQIRKLFTGDLNTPVVSFPPFIGKEMHYLRAQIARISATTQISPTGYYQFEEEEEEQEEGDGPGPIEINKEFEISKTSEYADGSMSNWSHHMQYILPQGRCQWFNPIQKADDEFEEDEDDDDEEKEQPEEMEPESGPQMLTSAAEDAQIDGMPAWSARMSSHIVPQYALAIVSSNLWPGAYAFAGRNKFENVYIGWGIKYSPTTFNPVLPPTVQEEFPSGADIAETTDPTVEQEAALKAALEEKQLAQEEEEEPEDSDDD